MPKIDNLVKQLKNRKVFRSLAIYAGFAFVLLQVCSIIIPGLFLPEWTMTFIIVLTIIGFPIIAVLSWIYDITPAKDGETPTSETTEPLGIYALTGLVLTVIGIGFWVTIGVFGISFGGDDEVPSIAIIPFDNKGAEEDAFYAYSISSELISDVASAGLIRVASKKQIEDVIDLPIDEIADKLFVRYVVTGDLWKADSVFQLSMELYDTKSSKVLWSKSWQRAWNELASIKGSLADNILKSLKVSTKQDIAKSPTSNTEAYKYYLEAKYIYDKRENIKDTEIARGLLRKAIELDDNLLIAKNMLAKTYFETGDYDKAMEVYTSTLKQAEEIGDKDIQGRLLNNIGMLYADKGDLDTASDYYERSLKIVEEIGDKAGIAASFNNIGNVYSRKDDLDIASDYYERSLKIVEEIGDKAGIAARFNNIGGIYHEQGDLGRALGYYESSLAIKEEIGDKYGMISSLWNIWLIYSNKGDSVKASDYYESWFKIKKELSNP